MICQKCGRNKATVKIVAINNGITEELYLCESCAAESGRLSFFNDDGFDDLFANVFNKKNRVRVGRMANRLTEKAQRALIYAEKTAKERHAAYIGTEHMLLGLFAVKDGIAAKVLASLGLNMEVLAKAIDDNANYGQTFMGFSPKAKRALQLAVEEAVQMGVNFVDTEHLLLGLAAEDEGAACLWLIDMADADLKRVRSEVMAILQQGGSERDQANKPGTAKRRGKSNTPTIDEFGRDLTAAAESEKLDPVIGREKEIQRVIQILSRRTKNNPVLMGEPGVGKTAIVEGLAQIIVEGKVPETLIGKRVITMDMSSMVAGSKYRGDFEERMKKMVDEIRENKDIILFIDELHTLVGAGAAEGSIDGANILKPALSRGELQCIGATTLDEYRRYIEKDAALERRFQPVIVGEPSEEDALSILYGLRDKYEAHHRVKITDEALKAAVSLSSRYLTERYLPDKAIDLIDEAASKVRLAAYTAPDNLKEMEAQLTSIQNEKDAAVKAQEYEKAAALRDKEHKLCEEIEAGRKGWHKETSSQNLIVNADDIAEVLSEWCGVPVSRLKEEEVDRMLKLEELLHQRIVGQNEAVGSVARSVRRARAGLKDSKRPIGSFIFLGPTGVGKTELARALANILFGSDDAMVRIDMSEYMEKFAVSRLVGAPPGYVGYEEGGQLTEAVRRKPYCVILLDEIEKAHPDVFNILLQVLEDGRLTDSGGRTIDFRNTVIIMTSNVGASLINREHVMGFAIDTDNSAAIGYQAMKERVMNELKNTFRPEFINRIDDIIVFHALENDQIKKIAGLMIDDLQQRLAEKDLKLTVSEGVYKHLVEQGFDAVFGARPLRRAILHLVEDPISEGILRQEYSCGDTIIAKMSGGNIVFAKKNSKEDKKDLLDE